MKKIMWSLSIIGMLGLINCGGGGKEAKELLLRILSLVGIPQTIVVNICQDKNKDGICNITELQKKITVQKGSSVASIFAKITNTEDGKYLLETTNPDLPLLLVLKDNESEFYTKEFTIPFTGLSPAQTEKNLSLLQAMVDARYLTADEIAPVETMTNQALFYATLLKDFEQNLNTLDEQNLSSPRAVLANLEEVAQELRTAGIENNLTNEIDACGDNNDCVEKALEETIITDDEVISIQAKETSTTKNLFAGKTLYAYYLDENNIGIITELIINEEVSSWNYKEVVGGIDIGIKTIEVEGDKLTIYHPEETNPDVYSTIAREEYILLTNSSEVKLFASQADAEAQITPTNSKEKLVKDLVSGHVTFKKNGQNTSAPSNAWVRFVPSRNQKEDNYSGVNCKIESNGDFGLECYVNNEEEQALRNDFKNNSETFQVIVYADTNADRRWNKEEESYGFLGNNVSNGAWNEFEVNLDSESTSTLNLNTVKVNWNNEELLSITILTKKIEIRKKDENSGFAHIPEVKAKLDNGYTIYFKYCALNPTDSNSNIESLCTNTDWNISLLDGQDNTLYNNGGGFGTADDPYNGKVNGNFSAGEVTDGGISGQFNIDGMAVIE